MLAALKQVFQRVGNLILLTAAGKRGDNVSVMWRNAGVSAAAPGI